MPPKRPIEERDQLVVQEFEHIREQLGDVKRLMTDLGAEVSALRNAEIVVIRSDLAKLESRLNVLEYQNKSSRTWVGHVVTPIVSLIVAAVASAIMVKAR
jgi:hypothetical protein